MSIKNFIYSLIIGISIVNFLPALGETKNDEIIAQERIAQSLNISVLELKKLLLSPQKQDIALIVDKKYSKGWTPLMYIAKGKFLCKGYAKKLYPECRNEGYQKILLSIYLKIAELLIKNSADINARNDNDKSALMIAFNSKNEPIIELLLQYNIDMKEQDKNGFTPLHHVIRFGYDDIACQLIKKGAPLNIKTKGISYKRTRRGYTGVSYGDEETPLMFAARRNSLPLVQCLLDAGANPLLKNIVGQTAADIATDSNVKEVIEVREEEKKLRQEALRAVKKSVRQQKLQAAKEKEEKLQAAERSARRREERKEQELQLQATKEKEEALRAAERSALQQEKRKKKLQKLEDAEEQALRQEELRVATELARQQEEREKKLQKLEDVEGHALREQKLREETEEWVRKLREKEQKSQLEKEAFREEELRVKAIIESARRQEERKKQRQELEAAKEKKLRQEAEKLALETESFGKKLFDFIEDTFSGFMSYFE